MHSFSNISLTDVSTSTHSDPNERAHFWLPDSPLTTAHELLDTPLAERMYIDQGEVVRVRVETDEFYDDEPGPPKAQEGVQMQKEAKRPPYSVVVRLIFSLPPLVVARCPLRLGPDSARSPSKAWAH